MPVGWSPARSCAGWTWCAARSSSACSAAPASTTPALAHRVDLPAPRHRAVRGRERARHRAARRACPWQPRDRPPRPLPPARRRGRLVRAAAPGARPALVGRRGRARASRDPRLLAALAVRMRLRRALARDGPAVGHHAEALHLRPHRRHGRGAHLQPARDARRRPQLGLPLRVAARLGLHGLRVPAPGLLRRGRALRDWLEERCRETDPDDPSSRSSTASTAASDLTEHELAHLEGYRGSRPVRIGNGAHDQLQLDVYGELMDAVYLSNKQRAHQLGALEQPAPAARLAGRQLAAPDEGIWEVRGGRARLRLLAADVLGGLRARDAHAGPARAARRHAPSGARRRDEIYEEIMDAGWSPERQAFVQYYGGDVLDASNLLMPLVKFIGPRDPRMLSTLDAIERGARLRQPGVPLRPRDGVRRRPRRLGGGLVLALLVLAGGVPHPRRPPRRGPPGLREDAHLRQQPRPLRRGGRRHRRGARATTPRRSPTSA